MTSVGLATESTGHPSTLHPCVIYLESAARHGGFREHTFRLLAGEYKIRNAHGDTIPIIAKIAWDRAAALRWDWFWLRFFRLISTGLAFGAALCSYMDMEIWVWNWAPYGMITSRWIAEWRGALQPFILCFGVVAYYALSHYIKQEWSRLDELAQLCGVIRREGHMPEKYRKDQRMEILPRRIWI